MNGMEIELWEGSLVSCWECHVNGGNENDKENNYVLIGNNENSWEENSDN